MAGSSNDLQMQYEEKEKLVEQLKVMIVEKDNIIARTQSELQDTKTTLSKTKLQAKAKVMKLTNQLEEAKKAAVPDSSSDRGSECGDETPGEQVSRGKVKLLRRKLQDKERLLLEKDEQVVKQAEEMLAKNNNLQERDHTIGQLKEIVNMMKSQLLDRDKIIRDINESENPAAKSQETMDQIYAQILSKDKKIVDLNNSIIDLDTKIKDLQEFIGEKNEVINGRDKVIGVLQTSIVEKDQTITSQNALISRLTNKVEFEEEKISLMIESLEKAEHNLKVETERFNLRLTETQKYFEETINDREGEISQLRHLILDREKDLVTRDNDLRELLARHEQDLENIMSKEGGGNMQDQMVKMMEQKVKDINEVLHGKIQVIEIQANDLANKDQQLHGIMDSMKNLKEKLAVSTEQNLLMQQTFSDYEAQWKSEKQKMETRLKMLFEKSEEEKGEISLQLHTVQVSLKQYESAYSQAALHYNALQERYQQVCSEVNDLKNSVSQKTTPAANSGRVTATVDASEKLAELSKRLEFEMVERKQLVEQFHQQNIELENVRAQLQNYQQQKQEGLLKSEEADTQNTRPREKHRSSEGGSPAKISDSRMLKIKAQFTAKIKSLEKEIEELKKNNQGSNEAEELKNRLAEAEEDKEEMKVRLAEAEHQNVGLQTYIQELEGQFKIVHEEVVYLRERASTLETEQNGTPFADGEIVVAHSVEDKLLLTELQQKCSEMSEDLQRERQQTAKMEADLVASRIEIEGLKAQIQVSDAAVEQLQRHLVDRSELEQEKVDLEMRNSELEDITEALEKEKCDLEKLNKDFQLKIEYEKQPNIAFEEENSRLQLMIQELQNHVAFQDDVSKKQKEEINELIAKLQATELVKEESLANIDQVMGCLKKDKNETDEELKKTHIALTESQTKLQQTEAALQSAIAEHETVKVELQQSLEKTANKLQQQSNEIGHICQFLDITENSVERLFCVVREKVECVIQLQQQLQIIEKSQDEKHKALESKESEVESLKSQLQNYEENVLSSVNNMAAETNLYKENMSAKDESINLLQETIEMQTSEICKFKVLYDSRDKILASLEQKVESYENEASVKQQEFLSQTALLQEQIETLQKDVEDKKKTLSESEAKVESLYQSLQEKTEEVTTLVSERSKMDEFTDRLVAEKQAEFENLNSSVEKLTNILNEKQSEFDAKLQEINSVVLQLNTVITEKDAQIEKLSSKVSELTAGCNKFKVFCEKLQTEKVANEKTLQEYTSSGEMVKDLLVNRLGILTHSQTETELPLSETLGLVISQIEGLLSEKVRLESTLQHSEKNNEMLKSNVDELERKCADNDLTLVNLQSNSSEQELAVKKLMGEKDTKISSLQDNVESLNLALQQSQVEAQDLIQQLKNLQDNCNFMQQQLKEANSQLESLTQQQTSLQEEVRFLKEQETSRETNRQDLEHSLADQEKKVRLLSENLELALHEKKCMHAEVENGVHEMQLVTNTNLELTRKIGQLEDLLTEKGSLLEHLSDELEKEKSQQSFHLEKCTNQIIELEQALVSSNSKLSEVSAEHKDQVVQLGEQRDELLVKLSEYDNNQLLLHERVEMLTREGENFKGKLVEAQQLVSEKKGIIEVLQTSLKNAEDKVEKMNAVLQETLSEKKHLEEEIKKVGSKLETERELRINIESVNRNIKKTFEELDVHLQTSVENETKLVKDIELLQCEKHETEMDIVNFKASLQEKEDLIRNLMSSVDETKESQQDSNGKLQELLKENQLFQQVIKDLQIELRDSKVTSEKSVEGMKSSVREGEVAAESFRKSYESLKDEHDILCEKLKESEYNLEKKNLELSRIQSVLNDSQMAIEDSFEKVKKESQETISDLINKNQNLTAELNSLQLQMEDRNKVQKMVEGLNKELVEKSKECAQLKIKISINEEACSEINQLIDFCLWNNYSKETLPETLTKQEQSEMPSKKVKKQIPDSSVDGSLKKKGARKSTKKSKSTASLKNVNTATAELSQRHDESDVSSKGECGSKIIIKKLKDLVSERENLSLLLDSINPNFGKDSLKEEESISAKINQFCKNWQEQKLLMENLQQIQKDKELKLCLVAEQLTQVYDNCACVLSKNSEQNLLQDSEFLAVSDDKSDNTQLEGLVGKFSKLYQVLQAWTETQASVLNEKMLEPSQSCSREDDVSTTDHRQSDFVVKRVEHLEIETMSSELHSKEDLNSLNQARENIQNMATMQRPLMNFFTRCQQSGINVNIPAVINKENLSEDILEASLNGLFDGIVSLAKESNTMKTFIQNLEDSSQDQVLNLIKRKNEFIGDSKLSESGLNKSNLSEFDEERIMVLERNIIKLIKDKEKLENKLVIVFKEKEDLECQLSKIDEVELLRITIRKLEDDLKKKLMEKDLVAEQLAKVDMELVSTSQERDKLRCHLEQVLREHQKCHDVETRLEKILREKQILSQKVMDMESKISQINIDKERLKKHLAETKPKMEKSGPLIKRRTRSQEVGDRKLNRNSEDSKRKSSLTKKPKDKCLSGMSSSRYGSVESVRSEVLRVSSPTLSEKSYTTSDSCTSEMSWREELIDLRAKTDAYSKHFEDLKMFWRNDICNGLNKMFSPEVGFKEEPKVEVNEKVIENTESIAIRVENLKFEMLEILTKIENWKSSFSEMKAADMKLSKEKYPKETTEMKDTEAGNNFKEAESVGSSEVKDLQNKNERLRQVCVKLKKANLQNTAEIKKLEKQLETANSETEKLSQLHLSTEQKEQEIKINDFEILVTEMKDSLDVKTAEITELKSVAEISQLSFENIIKQLEMALSTKDEELSGMRICYKTVQESFTLLIKKTLGLVSLNQISKPEINSIQEHMKQLYEELDSALFQSLDECQEKSLKTTEALKLLTIFLSQHGRGQQEISTVLNSFISCLKEIQNDIKEESLKHNRKPQASVLEDLSKIVNSSNYLEHFTSTEEQFDPVKLESEMCLLDDSNTQTGLNFLNWLRNYLRDLLLSHVAEHSRFLDIVSELNVVVVSKEEAIQSMSETIETMSSERKKLVKEVARLQNACDDSHSTAVSHSEETKRVKNSLDALENRISGLLTYVKDVHGSTLETIMEESEEEEECCDDVTDGLVSGPPTGATDLDSLRSLQKHFASFAAAYSHVSNVCNNRGSEIEKLRSLLSRQQGELGVRCPEETTLDVSDGGVGVGDTDFSAKPDDNNSIPTHSQNTDSTPQGTQDPRPPMSTELCRISEELDEVKQGKLQADQQLVTVQNHNEELKTSLADFVATSQELQSYAQSVQEELQRVKSELESTDENCKLKDSQIQEFLVKVEVKSAEIDKLSTDLQEAKGNLDLANKSLLEKDNHVAELTGLLERANIQQQQQQQQQQQEQQQHARAEQSKEVSLLREQLSVREQQLQNLTLEIAENMRELQEQQGKLDRKDEKIMSLVENMQELEEQLTDSRNVKEECEAKISELESVVEKEKGGLESTKKLLQNKENQYLKVLATAKKLKLQYQEAKKENKLGKDEIKETNEKVIKEITEMTSTFQQKLSTVLSEWPESMDSHEKDILVANMFEKRTEECSSGSGDGSIETEVCKATFSLLQTLISGIEAAKQIVIVSRQENLMLKRFSQEQEALLSDFNQKQEILLSQNLEKEDLLSTIEEKDQRLAAFHDRVCDLERCVSMSETATEKDVRISFLNEQLDESGHTIHLLQKEITEKNKALEDRKLNQSKLEEKVLELTDQEHHQLKEMTLKMEQLSEEIKEKNLHIEELSSLLQASEEKMVDVSKQLYEKEATISELTNAMNDITKQNQYSVEELKSLKEIYNQTVEELQSSKEDINNNNSLLKQIQHQLEYFANEIQQKEQIIVEYREQLEQFQSNREKERDTSSNVEMDLKVLYEKLKVESSQMCLDKERLAGEWKEAINENNQLCTELQTSEEKMKALEESLSVSHGNIEKMEEDIEKFTEDLLQSSKEKLLLSENLEQLKMENSMLKEKCKHVSSEMYPAEVPLETNLVKEHQSMVYSIHVEKEAIQRSEAKNSSDGDGLLVEKEKELNDVREKFESLSQEYDIVRSKHQIATEKCEKILVKFKSFKDKNSGLLKEMEKLKKEKESKVLQLQKELDLERLKNQELSAFCQQEEKYRNETFETKAKLEDEKIEIEKRNQKLLTTISELQSKCDNLSKQVENVTSEKLDSENMLATLRQEMETINNQFSVEKSTLLNQISNLEGECKNVYADLEDFQQLVRKYKEIQDNLKSENHKLREAVAKLEKELVNSTIAEDQNGQIEIQLQGLFEERNNLKDQVNGAREEVMNHRKEAQMLRKELEEAKDKLQEQEIFIAELEKTKKECDEEDGLVRNDLEVRLSAVEIELETKVSEANQLKSENQILSERIMDEVNERELYKREAQEASAVGQQLRESQKREEELEQEKMYLEENFQTVKMELEANKEMLRQNMKEIEELTAEVNQLAEQINNNNKDWRRQIEECELEVGRKEESLTLFKSEMDHMSEEIERLTSENCDLESTRQAVDMLKKEKNELAKELQQEIVQNEELAASREELVEVNERYNTLLNDNTHLAKQFEELRNKMQTQVEKEQNFAHEQQEHLKREQVTFTKRVEELEDHVQELTNQNTELKQEMVQVNSSLKEAHFENESLKSQLQVIQHGGDRLNQFQEDYQKLQEQFSKSIEQNNGVEAELNQANHRLQLRESRCQQLAMQVSQLAEDRSYLNIQMGNLSLALREKEKESNSLTHQMKDHFEKQTQLQQRITELESSHAAALKTQESQQPEDKPHSTQTEHNLHERIRELEEHQEELMATSIDQATKFTAERNQRLQAEIMLQQSQQQLNLLREKMQQDFKVEIDDDDDPDRILQVQPLLVRQGSNYFHRIQRWMKVKKEYFCFSSRSFQRLLRFRPNLRAVIWFYFLLLHAVIIACFTGFL